MIANVITLRKASARFSGYDSRFLHISRKSYLHRDETGGVLFGGLFCLLVVFFYYFVAVGFNSKKEGVCA